MGRNRKTITEYLAEADKMQPYDTECVFERMDEIVERIHGPLTLDQRNRLITSVSNWAWHQEHGQRGGVYCLMPLEDMIAYWLEDDL